MPSHRASDAGVAKTPLPLLDVRELVVRFGGITALQDVSFTMHDNQIVGLIGPNGAGKTTLFNCLSRLYQPTGGDVFLSGKSLLSARRHEMAGLGIGRTFQNVALFDAMSVADNVLVGGHVRATSGFLRSFVKPASTRLEEHELSRRADELIEFMNIRSWRDRAAGGLPFPIRKRVELARALMSRPRLLLLDEPAAGLNHQEVDDLRSQIRRIHEHFKVAVLLVEHHMDLVMSVSEKIVAINFGRKIAEGTPEEVRRERKVIEAYLGS